MPEFNVAYLDLAIGLAVAFFLLSLVPSALNEAFAFVFRIRSKFLWSYLNQLFTKGNPQAPVGTAARTASFSVSAEVEPDAEQTGKQEGAPVPDTGGGLWRLMWARGAPDPRPDAAPLVDDVTAPIVDRLHRRLMPIGVGSRAIGKRGEPKQTKTTIKHIPATSFAQALLELLRDADPSRPDDVGAAIEGLKGSPAYETLKALWASSEGSLQRFRDQVERWFDAEMARLSGLYKRVTRWILAGAAIVVAILVNVDSIALGRDLWRDPETRAAFVDVATAAAATGDADAEPADGELDALFDACRSDGGGASSNGEPTVDEAAEKVESLRTCVVDALEAQRQLGLLNTSVFEPERFGDSWSGDKQIPLRPIKLALVALAIFLGAPFWYDAIRRLVGLREPLARRET